MRVKAFFTIYRVVLVFSTEGLGPAVAIVKIYQSRRAFISFFILFFKVEFSYEIRRGLLGTLYCEKGTL